MNIISAKDAAIKLGVSIRRVQQLAESGRLPSQQIGGTLVIEESDLALVADRKTGRPKKEEVPVVVAANLAAGQGKPAAPSKSKPEVDKKGKPRKPVLWPETTEVPPILKKPAKKATKKGSVK